MEHIELKLADEPLYDELVHQSLRRRGGRPPYSRPYTTDVP